jgi:hypothetical protein
MSQGVQLKSLHSVFKMREAAAALVVPIAVDAFDIFKDKSERKLVGWCCRYYNLLLRRSENIPTMVKYL